LSGKYSKQHTIENATVNCLGAPRGNKRRALRDSERAEQKHGYCVKD